MIVRNVVIKVLCAISALALVPASVYAETLTRATQPRPQAAGMVSSFNQINPTRNPAGSADADADAAASGPLRVHPANKRYLTDANGRIVFLAGAHYWTTLQDQGPSDPPPTLNYNAYLDNIVKYNHNFIKLWAWENARWANWVDNPSAWWFSPMPYQRTGPGAALDGKPKFDLTKFNQAYFDRLRSRVAAARDRGVYVAVMLFNGWSLGEVGSGQNANSWLGHPYNASNNVNGINGDRNGDDRGYELHTLGNQKALDFQKAYVRKVIDTVNDLDNVLYEISNESDTASLEWQSEMVSYIKSYEKTKPKQHLVGMTTPLSVNDATQPASNAALFASPADWISPSAEQDYQNDPPAASGEKVVLVDTDHLWGEKPGSDDWWVWKSFTRGLNPIFMNDADGVGPTQDWQVRVWTALGQVRSYARRMNLAQMTPRGDLTSSGYMLASPGWEYLAFKQDGGSFSVNLSGFGDRAFFVEWFNVATGKTTNGGKVNGGDTVTFDPPFGGHAALYLRSGAPALYDKRVYLPIVTTS